MRKAHKVTFSAASKINILKDNSQKFLFLSFSKELWDNFKKSTACKTFDIRKGEQSLAAEALFLSSKPTWKVSLAQRGQREMHSSGFHLVLGFFFLNWPSLTLAPGYSFSCPWSQLCFCFCGWLLNWQKLPSQNPFCQNTFLCLHYRRKNLD